MRAIDQLIEGLPVTSPYPNPSREDRGYKHAVSDISRKARSLASEEAEAKPTAGKYELEGGLVSRKEVLGILYSTMCEMACKDDMITKVTNLPRRYSPADKTEVEPLAVLADRKGYWRIEYQEYPNRRMIHIYSRIGNNHDYFEAPTYAEAEAKAKAWLMGQGEKK